MDYLEFENILSQVKESRNAAYLESDKSDVGDLTMVVLKLLGVILEDKFKLLDMWCFEADYGCEDMFFEIKGHRYNIKNCDELYSAIINSK